VAGILEDSYADLVAVSLRLDADGRTLFREIETAAAAYAAFRAKWYLADPATRAEIDPKRSLAHDRFIDACNALSRKCGADGLSQEWRATWGDARLGENRKRIGDFACHIAYRCMLQAR
jgi:hypothetical protein